MISDLLKTWSPDALRLYMARHHYRQVWSYNEDELADAAQLAKQLTEAVQARGGEAGELDASEAQTAFKQAMENDLDTPAALEAMSKLAQDILDANHVSNDLAPAQQVLREMAEVFGLVLDAEQPDTNMADGWDKHLIRFAQVNPTS
jgi:cysteinyl-tRNA synthetase